MNPTLLTRASTLLLLAVALSPLAPAQSALPPPTTPPSPMTEEAIELSPFVVTDSSNLGYAATSTLAGTRIKTDLRDLGSAITVITPEFLNDLGATNLEDLLAYTTSTEIGGMQGNFSAADLGASAQRYDLDEQRREPQSGARVRGLFTPNFTRGYFSSSIPIDSYNTGSITMSRGANSLLFGLGSAAGVMDNGLSHASLGRNSREMSLRIGSYGARRETFKINQVVLKNRLAVQLAGMEKNEQYRQDPAYDREKRIYGAFEAVVFRNERSSVLGRTAVRGSYEAGQGTRVPPSSLPPLLAWDSFFSPPPDCRPYTGQDYLQGYDYLARNWTRWRTLDTRRIPVTATTYRPGWFESPEIAAAAGTPNLLTPVHSTSHLFEQIGLAFSGGPTPSLGTTGLAGFQGWMAASNQALSPHLATRMYNEGQQGTGFKGNSLTDRGVFDYKNSLITGTLQDIRRKFDAGLVTLTLGYAIAIADLLLAPFTPSNTARSGGTIYPIIRQLPPLYDSRPHDPSARRIGSYLMWVAIASTSVTGSMFLTGLAPNVLAVELVRQTTGITLGWTEWFVAFAPVGVVLFAAVPTLAWWLYPPEVKSGRGVPDWAAQELAKLGPLTRAELLLAALVLIALALWVFAAATINATLVALLIVAAMLLGRVVTWDDVIAHKAAWGTLAWFGTLVALADGLNRTGFVRWSAETIAGGLGGVTPGVAAAGLVVAFFASHYLFASTTAHATALLPVVLAVGQGIAGLDQRTFALQLCLSLGLMGILTPYASGPSPIYYGSGYLPARDYWRLGAIFGGIFLVVYLALGWPWMALVR